MGFGTNPVDKFDIGKWLAENHEFILKLITQYPATEEQKLKALNRLVRQEHGLDYEQVSLLFDDDKIRLILDRYYLKQLH